MSSPQVPLTIDSPVVPRYGGGCVADIVPALLDPSVPPPSFLDGSVVEAPAVVVLVIDGMGWEQLTGRERFTPTISGLEGGPITTVAPSTTASALTSIVT
ncbi:MAG: alkaline phosphatase family protein, partial [Acidimicrobiales bacterium]